MRPGQPNIARLPETTSADALRVAALNAGPRRILLGKCFSRLALACGVQRFILLLRLESHDAGLLLRPCTLCSVETRRAIFPGKACFPRHPILGIGVRKPGDALLPHRARHHLPLPVDEKLGFIEPRACSGLPTRVVRHGTNERDTIEAMALYRDLGVGIVIID